MLERTTRSVRLTDAGQVFLEFAQRVLAEMGGLADRLRDTAAAVTGRVDLAATQSVTACGALPALLVEFHRQHAAVDVVLREESGGLASSLLRAGQADLALVQLGDTADEEAQNSEEFHCEHLYEEELVLAVAPGHPRLSDARHWADLADESFIAFNEATGVRRTLMRICAEAGFQPRIGFERNALGSIPAIAAAGLGIALLPQASVLVPGPQVSILPVEPALHRTISLLRAADRYQSFASRALSSLLRDRMAAFVPGAVVPRSGCGADR